MSKTNTELLAAYKKANKERKKVIIKKAGFRSELKYLASLKDTSTDTKKETIAPVVVDNDMLDQVIAFDTTGSMSSYIAAVRKHVTDLIPKLFADNPNLRIKIVAFGDYCDMLSPTNFGPAYQETTLTDNQNELINFVNGAKNTGGGDGDEFYELVIKKVVEETPWREGSKRAFLLIGDCQPHPVGYTYNGRVTNAQIDWKQEAGKAVGLGVQIDTLSCGHSGGIFYKTLSEMTDGVHLPFSSSEKTQHAIYATTSVRGSKKSRASFVAASAAAFSSGDTELAATYTSLTKKLVD